MPKPVRTEKRAPQVLRRKRGKPLNRRVRIKSVSAKNGRHRKADKGTVAKRRAAKRAATLRADARWAEAVRGLSTNVCESCRTYFLACVDAHHLWPKKSHPKLRHVVDNGIRLDRRCHDRAHENMREFRKWFAGRFPERWARLEEARLG